MLLSNILKEHINFFIKDLPGFYNFKISVKNYEDCQECNIIDLCYSTFYGITTNNGLECKVSCNCDLLEETQEIIVSFQNC